MASRLSAAITVAGVLAMAGAADGFVFWSQPAGAGPFFTYSGGGSDNGHFGNPTLVGNQFLFFPQNFAATSSNGVAAGINDRLEVRIVANAGHRITQILVDEFGDWAITGVGSVQAAGTMFLTDNVNIRVPTTLPTSLVMSPTMPISSPPSGVWEGHANRNLLVLPPDWTDITLILTNTLQATSQQGSTSLIRKTVVGGPALIITIVPAPGALALLGLAGLALRRRR
ncbi:MAG: hypothetical protein WD749_07325 [Phycisphaerales bacterium]